MVTVSKESQYLLFYFLGSLVSLPAELTEENLSKQSSLSSVGNKLSQKSLPLIVEEKAASSSSFLVPQVVLFTHLWIQGWKLGKTDWKAFFFVKVQIITPAPTLQYPNLGQLSMLLQTYIFFWAGHPICGKCIPHSRKHIVGQNGCLFRWSERRRSPSET